MAPTNSFQAGGPMGNVALPLADVRPFNIARRFSREGELAVALDWEVLVIAVGRMADALLLSPLYMRDIAISIPSTDCHSHSPSFMRLRRPLLMH